jgi:hypothetical protein
MANPPAGTAPAFQACPSGKGALNERGGKYVTEVQWYPGLTRWSMEKWARESYAARLRTSHRRMDCWVKPGNDE